MQLSKVMTQTVDRMGKVKHLKWLGILALLLGVGAGGAILVSRAAAPKDDMARYTTEVKAEDVTLRVVGSGAIQPVKTVNVSPKSAGRVMELLVDQGDRVTQGQLLARMDSQDAVTEVAQARANLAAAQARLETLQNPTRGEAIAQARCQVWTRQRVKLTKPTEKSTAWRAKDSRPRGKCCDPRVL
ncbi:MAG: biotin/lipoyl-binding protein [Alkalinema sp. RU_4_3]|nr:biotin/lipoyl-binding protein [Alkalinema sp. RU_4_3]